MDINNINKIINDYNESPLDDFAGFSPKEMHAILYSPFEESCPIKIKKTIAATVLEKIPAFQICKSIINGIAEADGIKLTKAGNFPPKMVQDIYDKKYIEDRFIENGITKLRSEKDWLPFRSLRIAIDIGGLIRKYKGKVVLTKKCKSYISNKNDSVLFKEILTSYCSKFNWAYNDFYSNPYTGQFGVLFLIHLLITYYSEPHDLKFFTNKYFNVFPTMQIVEAHDSQSLYTTGDNAVETRFFRRFAEWFGFVDIFEDKSEPYFKRKTMIFVNHILSEVMEYSEGSEKD